MCKNNNPFASSSINEGKWQKVNDIKNAFIDADAVVILTEWEEYAKLNWKEIASKMRKPAWVFDSRSIIDLQNVRAAEINVWSIGDGTN